MPGQQAYIFNKNNRLPDAVISAGVSPSARIPLIYPVAKLGNGNIRLSGNYTGTTDAQIDVKVLDDAFTNPVVSSPVFRGAGTGKLSGISVTGIDAQQITVECLSTGVNTQGAAVEIEGIRFRSRSAGAAGNAVSISIDDTSLVFTASGFSTLKALKQGDTAIEGQEWDFDTKGMLGDIIPDDAHRISFGKNRAHIYLQTKQFEGGSYKYHFVRPILSDVAAGTTVYFVTGGRTVTVTDGVTTETYADIVSIVDLWLAIRATSTLLEPVDSSIDMSRTLSGLAVRELTTKTVPYYLPSYAAMPYVGNRSSEYAGDLADITVNDQTKTELIEVKCIDNTVVGGEIWSVKGTASGEIGIAKTGVPAEFPMLTFTVPQKMPPGYSNAYENIKWTYKPKQGDTVPNFCLSSKAGINSAPMTITLEYKQKITGCTCTPANFSDAYLGLGEAAGGGDIVADLSLSKWASIQKAWIEKEMDIARPNDETISLAFAPYRDQLQDLLDLAAEIDMLIASGLEGLPETIADDYKALFQSWQVVLTPPVMPAWQSLAGQTWEAEWAPKIMLVWWGDGLGGDPVGYPFLSALTDGTQHSGAVNPQISYSDVNKMFSGQTVIDGDLIWKREPFMYNGDAVRETGYDFMTIQSYTWVADGLFSLGINGHLTVWRVQPSTANGCVYYGFGPLGSKTGATEPTWPTVHGQTVEDGDITWMCVKPTYSVAHERIIWDGTDEVWKTINFSDVDVSFVDKAAYDAYAADLAEIRTLYDMDAMTGLVNTVYAFESEHGLKKNDITDESGYQELDSTYYWEVQGDRGYLPAFTDLLYYSAIRQGGVVVGTKEFGLLIESPCSGSFAVGDIITLTIGGVTIQKTYQLYDITYLPTIAGAPLHLSGGIDGDDLYRWSVKGTVNAFPDFTFDRKAPAPYNTTHLDFVYEDGIVPCTVGDQFVFSVEGGRFVWRKDGGAWSAVPLGISANWQSLTAGLDIIFDFGVAPSFVPGDLWECLCYQENKAANFLTPWSPKYKGSGTISFAFPSAVTIDTVLLAGHNIASPLQVQASDHADFSVAKYVESVTVSADPALLLLTGSPADDPVTARYWRLVPPGGEHSIGYIFLGQMMRLSLDADSIRPLKLYEMSKQSGPRALSLYDGMRRGFNISHSSFLYNADFVALDEMIAYLKMNNNMPLFVVPNINTPGEAAKVQVDSDTVEPGGDLDLNAPVDNRIYTVELKLVGVL